MLNKYYSENCSSKKLAMIEIKKCYIGGAFLLIDLKHSENLHITKYWQNGVLFVLFKFWIPTLNLFHTWVWFHVALYLPVKQERFILRMVLPIFLYHEKPCSIWPSFSLLIHIWYPYLIFVTDSTWYKVLRLTMES